MRFPLSCLSLQFVCYFLLSYDGQRKRICIHQYSRHMQNEYPTSLKVQRRATVLGVSGCCSWSLKCVKVLRTWGRLLVTLAFATGVLFSDVLWPVLQTDILFETSLCRFLFFVFGPLGESWDRFLFFSLNFPEGLRLYLVMPDISCAGNTRDYGYVRFLERLTYYCSVNTKRRPA